MTPLTSWLIILITAAIVILGISIFHKPQETEHTMHDPLQYEYDSLLDLGISEETIDTVININGYMHETMVEILYACKGLTSFDQIKDD